MLEVSSDVSTTMISEDRLDSRIKRLSNKDCQTRLENHYMLFNRNVNLRQDNTVSLRVEWWQNEYQPNTKLKEILLLL